MKKLLPVLLALLLLAGCGNQTPTGPSENPDTTHTPTGLYDPDSSVEQETYGAVRAYPLEQNNYLGLTAMGSRLLLWAEDGTMTVLQGDTGIVAAGRADTAASAAVADGLYDSAVQGAAYYQPETRQMVLVNPQLQETDRIQLPEDIQGQPCISLVRNEIFYCVPGQIRALDIQTGVSRLIRSHSYADQTLQGVWFDGQMLLAGFGKEDGTEVALEYLCTDTGRTLYSGESRLDILYTAADNYLLSREDGSVTQRIYGQRDGEPRSLEIPEEQFADVLPMGGTVGYTVGNHVAMRYYDLESGKCTSHVTLYNVAEPRAFLAVDQYIWILAREGEKQVLYRWDLTQSPASDDKDYTARLITAEAPDTDGLATCYQRAAEMAGQHGVSLYLWQDALAVSGGYSPVPEYQVETIRQMLAALEAAMTRLPEGFLDTTLEAGSIHIGLVRRIEDDRSWAQFWKDGDCYILLTDRNDVTGDFYRGLAYAIDAHVLGNSRKFDDWNLLNPAGFAYSYTDEPREDQQEWLGGDDSAFFSADALQYPHNDRADVFVYAMTDGSAEAFGSEVMQAKLLRMCKAIREAYRLEKSKDTYPWEQYLNESLAYKK